VLAHPSHLMFSALILYSIAGSRTHGWYIPGPFYGTVAGNGTDYRMALTQTGHIAGGVVRMPKDESVVTGSAIADFARNRIRITMLPNRSCGHGALRGFIASAVVSTGI
jgi:hypothetical protein